MREHITMIREMMQELFEGIVEKQNEMIEELRGEIQSLKTQLRPYTRKEKLPKYGDRGFDIRKKNGNIVLDIENGDIIRLDNVDIFINNKPRAISTIYQKKTKFTDVEEMETGYNFITSENDISKSISDDSNSEKGFTIIKKIGKIFLECKEEGLINLDEWELFINSKSRAISTIYSHRKEFIDFEQNSSGINFITNTISKKQKSIKKDFNSVEQQSDNLDMHKELIKQWQGISKEEHLKWNDSIYYRDYNREDMYRMNYCKYLYEEHEERFQQLANIPNKHLLDWLNNHHKQLLGYDDWSKFYYIEYEMEEESIVDETEIIECYNDWLPLLTEVIPFEEWKERVIHASPEELKELMPIEKL